MRKCSKCGCAESETLDGFYQTDPVICEDCVWAFTYTATQERKEKEQTEIEVCQK